MKNKIDILNLVNWELLKKQLYALMLANPLGDNKELSDLEIFLAALLAAHDKDTDYEN